MLNGLWVLGVTYTWSAVMQSLASPDGSKESMVRSTKHSPQYGLEALSGISAR